MGCLAPAATLLKLHPAACCTQLLAAPSACPPALHSLQAVDMGDWFDSFSDFKSDAADPMPLAPPSTNSSGGYTNEYGLPANVYTGVTDQLLVRRAGGVGAGLVGSGGAALQPVTGSAAAAGRPACRVLHMPALSAPDRRC